LDEGEIGWIEDADRYLAHAAVLPEAPGGVGGLRAPAGGRFANGSWGGDGGDRTGSSGTGFDLRSAGAGSGRIEDRTAFGGEPPLGTPVLGRVRWGGRIEPDECWDEQWGRRLTDGQAQRPDTYALETELAGQFVVVRNAAPWEAR